MSAALLDPTAVEADIAKIQQYATGLGEIPGLTAATLQAPLDESPRGLQRRRVGYRRLGSTRGTALPLGSTSCWAS